MRKFHVTMGAGLLAGSLAIAASAFGEEAGDKKLAPADVPAKIVSVVNARLPGAKLTAAEEEKEHGGIVYDLEMTQDGLKYEMEIKEDGTVEEIEKEMKQPPEVVIKAINQKYPNAQIKIVMQVNKVEGEKETPKKYEATITTDGKDKEVVVALDGSSVKEDND